MIAIDITVDASAYQKAFANITAERIKRALAKTGGKYLMLQRQNIADGVTPDGAPFEQYVPSYQLLRNRAGRSARSRWLNLKRGEMLKSQRVNVKIVGQYIVMEVEFAGERFNDVFHVKTRTKKRRKAGSNAPMVVTDGNTKVSNEKIAEGNDVKRPFIGVSEAMANQLLETFAELIGLDTI